MSEAIFQFGPSRRMTGILTPGDADKPVLVLPSAGLLPRSGPFRLHVELARRMAAHGIGSFRFDLPGVGETARIDGMNVREATQAALDCLAEQAGVRSFVVGGVCSAADAGWNAALADDRVRGALLLDGLAFKGPWYSVGRLLAVLRRGPATWPGIIMRLLRPSPGKVFVAPAADYRDWPDRDGALREFSALLGRNVSTLWIYTGGYGDIFLHPRQFSWSFGAAARDPRVEVHHWLDRDHTFFARAHRDRLVATIERWLLRLCAAEPKHA